MKFNFFLSAALCMLMTASFAANSNTSGEIKFFTPHSNALKPKGKAVALSEWRSRTIIIPEKASAQDEYGAKLLCSMLNKIFNTEFQIRKDSEYSGGKFISIGKTSFAEKAGVSQNSSEQGYVIEIQKDQLYLTGGTRGSIYAVQALLSEDFGCRHYAPKEPRLVTSIKTNEYPVVPRSYTPVFEVREPLWDVVMHAAEWDAFNRLQPLSYFFKIPESMGGGLSNREYFIHTYDQIVPSKKYFTSHPEYFPLKAGKRHPSTQVDGQLCYTEEGVADVMAGTIEKAIAKLPGSRIYSISTNDNTNVNCECGNCQAIIKTDGVAGASLTLANRVAERLADKMPDIRITTLAYVESQKPTKTVKPSANTAVIYAPIRQRSGGLVYLPWSDIPDISQELDGWNKIAKHLYVWDYVRVGIVPFPNFDTMDLNFDVWLKNGVTGVFLESYEFHLNSLAMLKAWYIAQKMWNPSLKMNDLIEEFIAGYYGNCAPEIREYVDLQRKQWASFYKSYRPGASIRFDSNVLNKMKQLLEKAYSKAEGSPELQRKTAEELCAFYPILLTACTKKNLAEYEKNYARLLQLLKKHSIQLASNKAKNTEMLNAWKLQIDDIKSGKGIPLYCEESILLKDRQLWCGSTFVEDRDARTGKSARQIRNKDWGIQWNFAKLLASAPNQQVYVARIRMKTDFKKQHPGNQIAVGFYLWRAGINGVQGGFMNFSDLPKDGYGFIYPCKVYMYSPSTSGYFYNCIENLSEGESVLYDYLEFIPVEQFKDKALLEKLPLITL